jgi:hypothetical protein
MHHGHFDKTKVFKTLRDFMSNIRKPNSNSVLKSVIPVRPVLKIVQTSLTYPRAGPDLSDPFTGFLNYLLDMLDIGLD